MSELPNGWTATTLQDVTSPRNEKADPSMLGDRPFVGMDHIEAHTSRLLATQPVREVKSAVAVFKKGDILYGRLRPYLNKVHEAQFDGAASAEFVVIPPSPAIDQRFLAMKMRTPEFVALANQRSTGDRPRVTFESVSDFRIMLPPRPEQRRIVAKLDALLARTKLAGEELAGIPTLIEQYKQAILEKAFTGQLTGDWRIRNSTKTSAKEFRIARSTWARECCGEAGARRDDKSAIITRDADLQSVLVQCEADKPLPDAWEWCGLGEAFRIYIGATPSRKEASFWNGDIPWVSSGEVAFCRINDTNEKITEIGLENTSTKKHPSGSVLLGMIGEGKTRGQAAILNIEACNNQNCAAIRVSEASYPPEYVYWYLYAVYEQTRTQGGGNNQPALNKDRVQRIAIPLAPPDEALAVVQAIEKFFEPILRVETEISSIRASLHHLEQRLLAKAFRGELVPQDPNDQPAEKLLERVHAARNGQQ